MSEISHWLRGLWLGSVDLLWFAWDLSSLAPSAGAHSLAWAWRWSLSQEQVKGGGGWGLGAEGGRVRSLGFVWVRAGEVCSPGQGRSPSAVWRAP